MSNELIKLEELSPIVELYKTQKAILDKAKAVGELSLTAIKAISLKDRSHKPDFIDKLFEAPINVRRLAVQRKKELEDARKPYTQKMDAIKSLFTDAEKEYDAIINAIAEKQNEWEREKQLINKEAEQIKADLLAAQQKRIIRIGNLKSRLLTHYGSALSAKIVAMNKAFNAKTAIDLPGYAAALKAWNPILKNEEWTAIATAAISIDDADIHEVVVEAVWPELSEKWKASLAAEVSRLFDIVPSRIKELSTPTQTSIPLAARVEAASAGVLEDIKDMIQAEEANTDIAAMSASFTMVEDAPLLQAKGSVKKLMYVAKTHKAVAAIIQSYVTNDLNKQDVADMVKKFSFCFTAANTRLNDKKNPVTVVMDGLEVVEDIKTRVSK